MRDFDIFEAAICKIAFKKSVSDQVSVVWQRPSTLRSNTSQEWFNDSAGQLKEDTCHRTESTPNIPSPNNGIHPTFDHVIKLLIIKKNSQLKFTWTQ